MPYTYIYIPSSSYNTPAGPKAACGRPYSRGLTLTEKRQVLDYHNKLRSAVATGYSTVQYSTVQITMLSTKWIFMPPW